MLFLQVPALSTPNGHGILGVCMGEGWCTGLPEFRGFQARVFRVWGIEFRVLGIYSLSALKLCLFGLSGGSPSMSAAPTKLGSAVAP